MERTSTKTVVRSVDQLWFSWMDVCIDGTSGGTQAIGFTRTDLKINTTHFQ